MLVMFSPSTHRLTPMSMSGLPVFKWSTTMDQFWICLFFFLFCTTLNFDHNKMARRLGLIASRSSALFLCDMQENFRKSISYYPQIIEVSSRMLAAAKLVDMPVIVTEQFPKGGYLWCNPFYRPLIWHLFLLTVTWFCLDRLLVWSLV